MYKNIKKNNNGVAALAMVLLLMAAMLTVGLATNDIMINGLQVGKTQVFSTRAYFAAEAGAERILWEIRNSPTPIDPNDGEGDGSQFDFCEDNPADFCFDVLVGGSVDECVTQGDCTNENEQELGAGSGIRYNIEFEYDEPAAGDTALTSYGSYQDTRRVIRLVY